MIYTHTIIPKKIATIRIAVSIKKGSGTILINLSVSGFNIQRLFEKNIL